MDIADLAGDVSARKPRTEPARLLLHTISPRRVWAILGESGHGEEGSRMRVHEIPWLSIVLSVLEC
jgi:hypothetical protein